MGVELKRFKRLRVLERRLAGLRENLRNLEQAYRVIGGVGKTKTVIRETKAAIRRAENSLLKL